MDEGARQLRRIGSIKNICFMKLYIYICMCIYILLSF